jgi:hypothetical protein
MYRNPKLWSEVTLAYACQSRVRVAERPGMRSLCVYADHCAENRDALLMPWTAVALIALLRDALTCALFSLGSQRSMAWRGSRGQAQLSR